MKTIPLTDQEFPIAQQMIEHLCGNKENYTWCDFLNERSIIIPRSKPQGQDRYIINTDQGLMVIMSPECFNFQPKPIVGEFYYCKLRAGSKILPDDDKKYLMQFFSLDPLVASYQILNNDGSVCLFYEGRIFHRLALGNVTIESFEKANINNFIE